jgi:hypothetical protein
MEVAIDADEGVALMRARAELVAAFHFPHFLERLRCVAGDEVVERVQRAIATGDLEGAAAALDEEVVRDFVLVTTPERFADLVTSFGEVDTLIPMPVGIFALGLRGLAGAGLAHFIPGRESLIASMLGGEVRPT